MSASLVGSEMCIRDSYLTCQTLQQTRRRSQRCCRASSTLHSLAFVITMMRYEPEGGISDCRRPTACEPDAPRLSSLPSCATAQR
eukprot:1098846-Alexandrium_andersonii.AAC.1